MKAYLLDTHVWLWCLLHPEKIPSKISDVITNSKNQMLFSAASCWEIAIKEKLGKLDLPKNSDKYIPERCFDLGIDLIPISPRQALHTRFLPYVHQDPFDRLLIAQAVDEKYVIITSDKVFKKYSVNVLLF